MSSNWVVRHGAMRFLGEFDPEGGTYRRGDEVVLRTERGLELGQVLCPADPLAPRLAQSGTKDRTWSRLTGDQRRVPDDHGGAPGAGGPAADF